MKIQVTEDNGKVRQIELGDMTPGEDWEAVKMLSEKDLRVLLRLTVLSLRTISESILKRDVTQPNVFTAEGHAGNVGVAIGMLAQFEIAYTKKRREYKKKNPVEYYKDHDAKIAALGDDKTAAPAKQGDPDS